MVGNRQLAIPVALQTGVKEEILLLVGIAHHALMGDVRAVSACIESQRIYRCSLISQEITDLGHEEAACEERL